MADACCINAYDNLGCYMWLLKTLKSEDIWQDVCFDIQDIDNREVDYILYTDKCGCSCCLSAEKEIIIHTMNWEIKTFSVWISWSYVQTKWTEVFGCNWCSTMVRHKSNWYPSDINDWTLLVEETTLNQYNSGFNYLISCFSWSKVYIKAFALDTDWNVLSEACWYTDLWTDKAYWYSGAIQTVSLPPGTYFFQVWWAQGWPSRGWCRMCWWQWWYSAWCIKFNSTTTVYVAVWWQWCSSCGCGWWNGWGNGYCCWAWWGWGTDIRIGWDTIYYRRLVAGWWAWWGNAPNCCYWKAWWTYWMNGNGAWNSWYWNRAWWSACQTAWWNACTSSWYWSFGQWWNAVWPYSSWWGGGWRYWWGWWYDSDSDADGWYGWGWSWYIYTSAYCACAPSWYNHNTAYYLCNAVICCGWSSFVSPSWSTETWHTWTWYAKITKIS